MMKSKKRISLRLDIVVTDREGKVVETRTVESDILLRNFLAVLKYQMCGTLPVAADNLRDVLNNLSIGSIPIGAKIRGMLGSGTTAETPADYRIQTPLYTTPDAAAIGIVTLGAGNKVILAITSAHTFASATTVYEAGILFAEGSLTTYLTGSNYQESRNTFAGVSVPAGGTFTGTYTITVN